jgi:hypothetical protein
MSFVPSSKKDTTEGNGLKVLLFLSDEGMILISPSTITAAAELLVPKSIPKTFTITRKMNY